MTINDSAISEQGMCEEEQVARIAWFYYHDGLTQSEISDRLGLTRLKVSRLLEKGHQSGIIRVQINSRFEGCLEYETQLRRQFSLQHVRVIPGLADADVGGRLGIGAAHMLMSLLQPQQMLAIGFGEATMNTLQRLSGFISSQQIRLVTLSGGVGSYRCSASRASSGCGDCRHWCCESTGRCDNHSLRLYQPGRTVNDWPKRGGWRHFRLLF